MGLLSFDEPFTRLVHQGVIKGPDGQRMSKSRGNVINPEEYLEKYGSDVFRCYLMFGFDFQDGGPWDDSGIAAIDRFLNRAWRLVEENRQFVSESGQNDTFSEAEQNLNRVMHNSIKGVTTDTERFHFNTAISRIMELVNELFHYTSEADRTKQNKVFLKSVLKNLIIILSPFAPHLCEELWARIGEKPSLFDQAWPQYDPQALKQEEITWVVQINGKIRERANGKIDMNEQEAEEFALNYGRIPQLLEGKTVRKVIIIPRKLINIVAN
jgi:leucyl-tRNA synthetase